MNAAVVNVLGQSPVFQEFAEPSVEENEVLVHVCAAGLHHVVKSRAAGKHYSSAGKVPLIPGVDGVGKLEDGRRVYFGMMRQPWGTMAELAPAPRSVCIPLPDGIDDVTAAAIANPGMSAWVSLKERARLQAGETALILGATGVAGQLAIQSARLQGAKRIVAVGRNVDALKGADVDAIIGLNQPEEAVREAFIAESATGIDVVIDYVWGRPAELLLEGIARGYNENATHSVRYVQVGSIAGENITLLSAILRSVDITLLGSGFGSASMEKILAAIPTLFDLAAKGSLTIDVEKIPLSEVESSWNRSDKGKRIVFTI